MTEILNVTPGIDMSEALAGQRLTKKWLREYLRSNPQKDFRNHTGRGAYVNGEDCVNYDLSLEVRDPETMNLVAVVEFQRVEKADFSTLTPEQREQVRPQQVWGYVAVVR